jgi:hypothetical protein
MWSQMAAITGLGSRQLANAGGLVFLRVGSLGIRTFFRVSGGVTHGVFLACGLRGGGLTRSWLERLSMAVHLCVSITTELYSPPPFLVDSQSILRIPRDSQFIPELFPVHS